MRCLILALLWFCLATPTAGAQAPSLLAWSGAQRISPAAVAGLTSAGDGSRASSHDEALSHRTLDRARWLIGVGATVAAATTITYAFGESSDCGAYGDDDKTLLRTTAALLLAGGVAMATVGGIRLAGVPASVRARHSSSPLQRFGKAMTAIAAGATAAALTGASAWYGMSKQDYCFNN